MTRITFAGTLALTVLLAACGPGVPNSGATLDNRPVDIGAGVGFGNYATYESARLDRDRVLASGSPAAMAPGIDPFAAPISAPIPQTQVISSSELAAAGLPVSGNTAAGIPPQPQFGQPDLAAPLPGGDAFVVQSGPAISSNPSISDENSFESVSARETIESNADRIARQRAAYTQIQPEALPERSDAQGPNVVQFALATSNAIGQRIYNRGGLSTANKAARNCAKYPSPDKAQEEFLGRGGPERDRLGLDPDGDGFACAWNPAPFRAARGG